VGRWIGIRSRLCKWNTVVNCKWSDENLFIRFPSFYILRSVRRSVGNWKVLIITVSMIAVLGLLVPTNSFAIHNSENVTWQLVMVSSYPACSNYHYQMMNKYSDIAGRYLDLYQTPNTSYKPTCVIEEKLAGYLAPDDLDLLIIVYDRNKGRAELHSYEVGGIYSHIGKEWTHNHTIVFCDCSNFKYSDPVWILSHELSHFTLYYMGFDLAIVEREIHQLDEKFDYCTEIKHDESCYAVKTKMEGESQWYTVMKPYEDAVTKSWLLKWGKQAKPILENSFKKDMIAEVTSWWLEGKIVDKDYLKTLEILTGQTDYNKRLAGGFASADRAHVILTEPPNDQRTQDVDSEWSMQKILDIQDMTTYTYEQKRILATEEPDKDLPQWFKSRAIWWVNEKISNGEYISGMEYLLKP